MQQREVIRLSCGSSLVEVYELSIGAIFFLFYYPSIRANVL
jgi:hypothetical protein